MKSFQELQSYVETMDPAMRRFFASTFASFKGQAEEMTQEAIASTWQNMRRCYDKGMIVDDEALTTLWKSSMMFAIRQVKTGRRVSGFQGAKPKDVLDYALRGRLKIEHLNFYLILGHDDPVPAAVQTAIDFGEFLKTLSNRQRAMLEDILNSPEKDGALARKWEISQSAISQFRARIVRLYKEYLGD